MLDKHIHQLQSQITALTRDLSLLRNEISFIDARSVEIERNAMRKISDVVRVDERQLEEMVKCLDGSGNSGINGREAVLAKLKHVLFERKQEQR